MVQEILCELCGKLPKTRVRWSKYVCDYCEPEPLFTGSSIETVTLRLSNGETTKTPKREIDEIRRLRMLPYEKKGGGWYPGRLGENGKIEERYLKS